MLSEQQFGLFEGVDWTNGELEEKFSEEIAYYRVRLIMKRMIIDVILESC